MERLRRKSKVKKITLREDSYWQLKEMKARLRCGTWEDLIDKLYKYIDESEKNRILAL